MPSKYPWAKWLTKKRLVLREGTHYDLPSRKFAQQVRNAIQYFASGHSVEVGEKTVTISVRR